ncbi:MAG: type II toxin-antitoxin system VapC family toxin [Austwickia sp.]|nr:MAG: type II toxin-antitoxin system VapC family toxin [Austwickia sp.]
MIVVDASCLYEVVVDTPRAEAIRERLAIDPEQAAPHIVDIEVFGLIRRDYLAGTIDETLAALAVEDLRSWPGERFGHRALLTRAWELRHGVRGWDAAYVALAEILDATLVTLDRRLARATGLRCRIEALG